MIIPRAMDWSDCNGILLDGLVSPYICIPLDQIGLIVLLCTRILFARKIFDFKYKKK